MVLICSFLTTHDGEHLFLCFLAIHIFSLGEYLFKSLANFEWLFVLLLCRESPFYPLDTSLLLDM